MSRFNGKHCPVCLSAFTENDDVVVCPECGTPHHRDCYKKIGKCGVEKYHGSFVWSGKLPAELEPTAPEKLAEKVNDRVELNQQDPHVAEYPSSIPQSTSQDTSDSHSQPRSSEAEDSEQVHSLQYFDDLPELAAVTHSNDPFVIMLYAPALAFASDEKRREDDVSGKELSYFVGKSIMHYSGAFSRFRKQGEGKSKISFNFCAGLFYPVHQIYRRMDFCGIILLLATALFMLPEVFMTHHNYGSVQLEASLTSVLPTLAVIGGMLEFAATVLMALFGDYIYYKYCVRKIKKIRRSYDDGKAEGYYAALRDSGTPSKLRAVIGILAELLVYFFIAQLPILL